jgi:hypothetical protein
MARSVLEQTNTSLVVLGDDAGETGDVILSETYLMGVANELEDRRCHRTRHQRLVGFEFGRDPLNGFI